MPVRIRHCVECPKCGTRYLIAFSPYSNGSCLVPTVPGSSDEYTLYCSCGTPPACSRWKWSEVRTYTVSKTAHDRRFGTPEEIVPRCDQPPSTGAFDMVPSESDRKGESLEVKRIRWSVLSMVLAATCLAGPRGLGAYPRTAGEPAKSNAGRALEYRQFDFWIGDWDVLDVDSPAILVARAKVDGILDGCVCREHDQERNGLEGQSFSPYDARGKCGIKAG
jgi:hypothetical protein